MYVCASTYHDFRLLSSMANVELGPARREWHNKNYLGAAHGLCGILTVLLYFKEVRRMQRATYMQAMRLQCV
jgi:hypothetical protein